MGLGGPGGGGSPEPNPMGQLVVSSMAAFIMSGLMIALYSFVPHHEPRLLPDGPGKPAVADGLWEQKDFFGLIDTQWTMRHGLADGDALQYHSNGSLFRELHYAAGRLEGPVREYYEKGPYRQPPVRGRIATRDERSRAAGVLKKITEYRAGVPEGPYEWYDSNGILKEEGRYENGVRRSAARYRKDGRPTNSNSIGEGGWIRGR
jgi:hypothetical protein